VLHSGSTVLEMGRVHVVLELLKEHPGQGDEALGQKECPELLGHRRLGFGPAQLVVVTHEVGCEGAECRGSNPETSTSCPNNGFREFR
jgi:hypothetical protein